MKKLTLLLAAFIFGVSVAFAGPATSGEGSGGDKQGQQAASTEDQAQEAAYQLDQAQIDALFENAESVTETVPVAQLNDALTRDTMGDDGMMIAALVLCFFLGGLAIHRVVMGGRAILILLYFITCGGIFGILPLVDFILLIVDLVNGGGSRLEGNDKFIGW